MTRTGPTVRVTSPRRPATRVRLVIHSDVDLYAEGVALVLRRNRTLDVRTIGRQDLALMHEADAQALLIDATTARRTEYARAVADVASRIRVAVLGVHDDDEESVLVYAALGVSGFISATASPKEVKQSALSYVVSFDVHHA